MQQIPSLITHLVIEVAVVTVMLKCMQMNFTFDQVAWEIIRFDT